MTGPVIPVAVTIVPCGDPGPHETHLWHPEPSFLHGEKRCPGVPAPSGSAVDAAVVPVAAIEALASDLRKSAKGIRQATGDRLDALVAERQTEAPTDQSEECTPPARPESAQATCADSGSGDAESPRDDQGDGVGPPPSVTTPEVQLTDEERETLLSTTRDADAIAAVEAIVASRTEPLRAERDYHHARADVLLAKVSGGVALRGGKPGDYWAHWHRDHCAAARAAAAAEAERDQARADLAALRERVAETVERVQGEHRPTGLINSREGCVLCECDATLTVPGGYTRDGLEVEEWAERRAFEAHIAQQVAAALGGEGRG